MRQFQKTTLFELNEGDRFYFLSDKNKKPHEVVKKGTGFRLIKKDSQRYGKEIKADKMVVFLRNSNINN